jgi:hypothetical protein
MDEMDRGAGAGAESIPEKQRGYYRCPYECGDPRFPKPKWKTLKGWQGHVEKCPNRPLETSREAAEKHVKQKGYQDELDALSPPIVFPRYILSEEELVELFEAGAAWGVKARRRKAQAKAAERSEAWHGKGRNRGGGNGVERAKGSERDRE